MADPYQLTQYYDRFYAGKDYAAECERLREIIAEHLRSGGRRLLDVACGTAGHLVHLAAHFDVEGADISQGMVDAARERLPGVTFHCADMLELDLGETYDVVTCLFSSIGYVGTTENLKRAARRLASHVAAGGVLIIEPWFTPAEWNPGTVHALFIDEPELKLARVNTSLVEGRLSICEMHYLIGTPQGTTHAVERHELGLFTREAMEDALVDAGLVVRYDEQGLTGRGLYVAMCPGG